MTLNITEKMRRVIASWFLWIGVCAVFGFISPCVAQTPADAHDLAQRFRPYFKFSLRGDIQDARPISWQQLYAGSTLRVGNQVIGGPGTFRDSNARKVLDTADARKWDASMLDVHLESDYKLGPPFESAMLGNGIYAHISDIDDTNGRLVNIEYWVLFAYNIGYSPFTDHKGDIAGVQVVFDRVSDKLVRAAFSLHGHSIIMFDLTRIKAPELVSLTGRNVDGSATTAIAQKIEPLDHAYVAEGTGLISGGDSHILLTQDPATGRFEHLAVYLEHGSHEPWPNSSGNFFGVANHDGNGVSFLPIAIHVLDSSDDAFVFFGGDFGDPVGLTRHSMWYGFNEGHYPKDVNPYVARGPLVWPPVVDPTAGCSWTPFTSEERAPAQCSIGVVTAMRCDGKYCDNISLQCCPTVGANRSVAITTEYFSEENPSSRICPSGSVVVGLSCKGSYCDAIALSCAPAIRILGACIWSDSWFSEEGTGLGQCPPGQVVSGAQCRGSYCDEKRIQCCTLGVPRQAIDLHR